MFIEDRELDFNDDDTLQASLETACEVCHCVAHGVLTGIWQCDICDAINHKDLEL